MQCWIVPGHKADFGIMAVDPSPHRVDAVHQRIISGRLGAAIVPMNTRFKGTEAADILRRSRARLLFAPADFLGQDYAALIAGEDLPDLAETIHLDRDFASFVARATRG
jgi:hypothetical protein